MAGDIKEGAIPVRSLLVLLTSTITITYDIMVRTIWYPRHKTNTVILKRRSRPLPKDIQQMKFTLVKLSALALVAASMVSAEESQPELRDVKSNLPELRGAIQVVSVLVNHHLSSFLARARSESGRFEDAFFSLNMVTDASLSVRNSNSRAPIRMWPSPTSPAGESQASPAAVSSHCC